MAQQPRVDPVTARDQLAEADRAHFDAIEASRGGVRGPFTVLLNRPELAGRVADLGAYVRFEGTLPADVREVAILTTAAEWECAYVWVRHRDLAREAGVPGDLVDSLVGAGPPAAGDGPLRAVVRFTRQVLTDHRVSTPAYEAVEAALGTEGVVELVGTVGYYSLMSIVNNALRVVPDDPGAIG